MRETVVRVNIDGEVGYTKATLTGRWEVQTEIHYNYPVSQELYLEVKADRSFLWWSWTEIIFVHESNIRVTLHQGIEEC